jgi:hypothetical protein
VKEGNLLPFGDGWKAMMPIFAEHARRSAATMRNNAADAKEEWIREHAARLLLDWCDRNNAFSIAPEYVRQLEKDLAHYYEQPLMRAFIENTD